jgi:2-dehydropantoate 2-reductase
MTAAPILIWGTGAIGGTVGAFLQRAGASVLFVDRVAEHVAAIEGRGLQITGSIAEFSVKAPARTPETVEGRYDTIFLCVKAQDTAAAAATLKPFLADDGYVLSLQNGLNELIIAEHVGTPRTVGAFINFGADYLSPGVVHYAGRGAVVVGELDGRVTPRIEALHRLMLRFDERAVLTSNIWGFLWSKLAYGALLFATALTDVSIADCLASQPHRATLVALAREVLAVAAARGVMPEAFDGFDPSAFRPGMSDAAALRSLDDLVAFNRRSAKTHSGIWRDLAVRKRKTEIDAQLAPVARFGAAAGVRTPLVERLVGLIHDIEEGRRPLAWETLDALGSDRAARLTPPAAGERAAP